VEANFAADAWQEALTGLKPQVLVGALLVSELQWWPEQNQAEPTFGSHVGHICDLVHSCSLMLAQQRACKQSRRDRESMQTSILYASVKHRAGLLLHGVRQHSRLAR
jgi:hypothetical protein